MGSQNRADPMTGCSTIRLSESADWTSLAKRGKSPLETFGKPVFTASRIRARRKRRNIILIVLALIAVGLAIAYYLGFFH